ncbi:MAG: hypothetical protein RL685_7097, partial [Pseudomonadota bacterium]
MLEVSTRSQEEELATHRRILSCGVAL